MKRDLDLIRKLLLLCEDLPYPNFMQGHELLDAARSDKRWEEAKSVFRSIGGFTVDLLKTFLVELISHDAGLLR